MDSFTALKLQIKVKILYKKSLPEITENRKLYNIKITK